jgi:hypothetical protein
MAQEARTEQGKIALAQAEATLEELEKQRMVIEAIGHIVHYHRGHGPDECEVVVVLDEIDAILAILKRGDET